MEQENCNWFVFYKDQILILQTENGYHVPCCTEPPVAVPIGSTIHTIGEMNGLPCKTYSLHTPIPGSESPARQMMGLRASFDFLPLQEYQMGGKAFQILNWDQNSRYCPACGSMKRPEKEPSLPRNVRNADKSSIPVSLRPSSCAYKKETVSC